MSTILEASTAQWRKKFRVASFKGAMYHVEQQGRSSGRRVVAHEFPKRDVPYAEDMGRSVIRYQVTGYIIQNDSMIGVSDPRARQGGTRNNLDYQIAKERLIRALESADPGTLVDPYMPVMHLTYQPKFICERYSVSETRQQGGYATFEMMFVEAGQKNNIAIVADTTSAVKKTAEDTRTATADDVNTTSSTDPKDATVKAGPR